MLLSEQIREVRSHIEDPKHWTQGTFKADWTEEPAYCMMGACGAGHDDFGEMNLDVIDALDMVIGDNCSPLMRSLLSVSIFNDKHTHAEVLAVFDRAIEVAQANEQELNVVQADDLGYQLVETSHCDAVAGSSPVVA